MITTIIAGSSSDIPPGSSTTDSQWFIQAAKAWSFLRAPLHIAYAVRTLTDPNISIITPATYPNWATDTGWWFHHTQPDIRAPIVACVNTMWTNTPLFADYPLITTPLPSYIELIANPQEVLNVFDVMAFKNKLLQNHGFLTLKSWLLEGDRKWAIERGSEGVQLVNGFVGMLDALDELLNVNIFVHLEELLEGRKTVTLVPDGQGNFMKLLIIQPVVQVSGMMPRSRHVLFTKNTRVLSYLTGAGHPGRDDQDSLWAMVAKGFGWEYLMFVRNCIETARHLHEARTPESPGKEVGSLDNFTFW
ncbi:hypothetical protein B9Z19DRAFT_1126057 [Tuber borchii]|uniref:Uncharacterized protein n=1 Tax=Tuber borchii TaxID=42251 RepID=A0A2T6ZTL0_TUBBO|nr:hypothetical protein B9Z19DRAFT_1126057 [Tuber borchii]